MTIRFPRSAHSGPNNHLIHTSKFVKKIFASRLRVDVKMAQNCPRRRLPTLAYDILHRHGRILPVSLSRAEVWTSLRTLPDSTKEARVRWPCQAESWRGAGWTAGPWRAAERHQRAVEHRRRGRHFRERRETELRLGVHLAAWGEGPATAPDKNASQKGLSPGWVGDGDNSSATGTDDRRAGTSTNAGGWYRDQQDQAVGHWVSGQAHLDQYEGQGRSSKTW